MLCVLLLFGVAVAGAAGGDHHGDGHDDQCVDVSRYSEVQYNISTAPICTYRVSRKCETKMDTACVSMPKQECEVIGYSRCKSEVFTRVLHDDTIQTVDFHSKTCQQDGYQVLNDHHQVPECHNVTREHCDSKWVLDSEGNKVWAGNENCVTKTWEECVLVDKPNPVQVAVWKCFDDQVISYDIPVLKEVTADGYTTKCEADAYAQCTTSHVLQCTDVQYQECTDVVQPVCIGCSVPGNPDCGVNFRIPYQTYDHRLTCIVDAP